MCLTLVNYECTHTYKERASSQRGKGSWIPPLIINCIFSSATKVCVSKCFTSDLQLVLTSTIFSICWKTLVRPGSRIWRSNKLENCNVNWGDLIFFLIPCCHIFGKIRPCTSQLFHYMLEIFFWPLISSSSPFWSKTYAKHHSLGSKVLKEK